MYLWLINFFVQQKPIQHCKATIFQLKKKSVPFILHLVFSINLCGFAWSLETTKTLKAFSSMNTSHQHTEPQSWELKVSLTFACCPTFPRGELWSPWEVTWNHPEFTRSSWRSLRCSQSQNEEVLIHLQKPTYTTAIVSVIYFTEVFEVEREGV